MVHIYTGLGMEYPMFSADDDLYYIACAPYDRDQLRLASRGSQHCGHGWSFLEDEVDLYGI